MSTLHYTCGIQTMQYYKATLTFGKYVEECIIYSSFHQWLFFYLLVTVQHFVGKCFINNIKNIFLITREQKAKVLVILI